MVRKRVGFRKRRHIQRLNAPLMEEIVETLRKGNEHFLRRRGSSLRRQPAQDGPEVVAAVLSCSDMQEDVSGFFGLQQGELVTITRSGVLIGRREVDGARSAAAMHGIRLILILGHTKCDFIDVYREGGQVTPRELHDALSDSKRATIAGGMVRVSKNDLVRVHTCRMAQLLRAGLGLNSGVVVRAAQFDEQSGRVSFY